MENPHGIPPELLQEILGSAYSEEEKAALKNMAMAQMLGQQGVAGRNAGGSNPVGGAAGAIAQGLSGYMGGKMQKEGLEAMKGIGQGRAQGRQAWWEAMFGGGPGELNQEEDLY
jgi:hypothetical protein